MTVHDKSTSSPPPVVDEWGFYDPSRAGLAAVLDRLAARDEGEPVPPPGTPLALAPPHAAPQR
jgi:hypothetical protein